MKALLTSLFIFQILGTPSVFATAVYDETQANFYQIPEGSHLEFTMDKIIPIQTPSLELGSLTAYDSRHQVTCSLNFAPSNDLRSLQGLLQIDLSPEPEAVPSIDRYSHVYTFGDHAATLNGKPVAIHFSCTDICNQYCNSDIPSLKVLRNVIEHNSGQLILSKPIPFKI